MDAIVLSQPSTPQATPQASFYFYDYETWGADPKKDRPAQFGGIRTDLDLNPIGEPDMWYCQLANDYLPHPVAALITGLTPQLCNQKGLPETEFCRRILERFSQPNTCVLGYNSLRFDDEVTRYSLYRNFYEPYGREWQQGNSRWDLIDIVRAVMRCALKASSGQKKPMAAQALN
jgi:exodeoxyribonuclease-1